MRKSPLWRVVAGTALTIACFVFVALQIRDGWTQIADLTWRIRPFWLAISFILVFANFVAAAQSWVPVFAAQGEGRIRLSQVFTIIYTAQLGRYLPGRVWLFVGQAEVARRMGFKASSALAASVVQNFAGTAAGLLVAAGCAALTGEPLIAACSALAGLVLLLGLVGSGRFAQAFFAWVLARFGREGVRIDIGARAYSAVTGWCVLSWILHVAAVVALAASLTTIDANTAWRVASSYVFAYLLAFYSLITPAGLGVREGAVTALLGPLLGSGPAGVLAIVQRIWFTLCESAAFVVALGLWRRSTSLSKKPG